jgi:hypothetical protein
VHQPRSFSEGRIHECVSPGSPYALRTLRSSAGLTAVIVASITALPFTSSVGWGAINVEGWTPQPGQELQVDQRAVTPGYFDTMRIPVLQGRAFTDADLAPTAEQVAIIDGKFLAQR